MRTRYGRIEFEAVGNIFDRRANLLIGRWDDGFWIAVPGIAAALDDTLFMPSVAEAFEERRVALEAREGNGAS